MSINASAVLAPRTALSARLSAAAPELLEALENIVAAMETDEEAAPTASWMDNLYASVDAARAIIAKATSPKGK